MNALSFSNDYSDLGKFSSSTINYEKTSRKHHFTLQYTTWILNWEYVSKESPLHSPLQVVPIIIVFPSFTQLHPTSIIWATLEVFNFLGKDYIIITWNYPLNPLVFTEIAPTAICSSLLNHVVIKLWSTYQKTKIYVRTPINKFWPNYRCI